MKYSYGFFLLFLFVISKVQGQIYTQWSPYSDCTATCNTPYSIRTRQRTCTPANLCQNALLTDTIPCNTQYPCPDYRLGDWGSWSACSESCRVTQSNPTRVRTRSYCLSNSTSTYQCTSDFMVNYEPCNTVACSIVKSCDKRNFTFVFVMDVSFSIDDGEWISEKELVKSFVNGSAFEANQNVDVAVVLFGNDASVSLPCNKFTTRNDFFSFMDKLNKSGGSTAINQGLLAAREVYKSCPKNNMLPVVVLLTDGEENIDHKNDSRFLTETQIKSEALLIAGAVDKINRSEINRITSYYVNGQNVSYSFFADDFTSLLTLFGNKLYPFVLEKSGCETQGQWTAWTSWGGCSQSCGVNGNMQRSRSCINPTTNIPQEDCEPDMNGANYGFKTCFIPCTTFSDWTSWGTCSASCRLASGPPTSSRYRTCLPGLGVCIGDLSETQECNTNIPCQGITSPWGAWSQCSASCQLTLVLPTQQSVRSCDGASLGGNCNGDQLEKFQTCSVGIKCQGTISEWTAWDICSATCDNLNNSPYQTRTRFCSGYSTWDPLFKGCDGFNTIETRSCNAKAPCPGTWSAFGAWGVCSETCQSNINVPPFQTQTRQCIGATFGGVCVGSDSNTQPCNERMACPGVLSAWSAFVCSATCQYDFNVPQQISTRTCTGSTFGGNCNGAALIQSKNCVPEVVCPGTLSDFGAWSDCSATCNTQVNGPTQYRTRSCTGVSIWKPNVVPCNGAILREEQICNQIIPCPGNYGEWGAWGTCSETCQSNTNVPPFQTQTRPCLNATLSGTCVGDSSKTQACNVKVSCPGSEGLWGEWEACSASCQMAYITPTKIRRRLCIGNTFNGNCNGVPLIDTSNCNEQNVCQGTISEWTAWDTCSATCDNLNNSPSQTRTRFCSGYSTWDPLFKGCDGFNTIETRSCNAKAPCPGTWSAFGAWGVCSESCQSNINAPPFQTQTRQCIGATFGGICVGSDSNIQPCNERVSCPGVLSAWSAFVCSATCQYDFNVPQQISTRTCTGSTFGGNCNGASLFQSKNCVPEVVCPGTLSDFGAWSDCSASCNTQVNGPTQYRTRSCTGVSIWKPNVVPCNGAILREEQICNQIIPCPGTWSAFGAWGVCSESCQSNINAPPFQTQTRQCLGSTLGGVCVGSSSNTQPCNERVSCPGDLTQWSVFSACSQSCQISLVVPTMSRIRNCLNPTFSGNCLSQPLTDVQPCNSGISCPGQLTEWAQWSQCPATCQQTAGQFNFQYRSRQCVNTSFSGNCGGQLLTDQTPCVVNVPCPGILSQWTSYSACSESCVSNPSALPSQTRTRTCTTATLGANCGGLPLIENLSCNGNVGCPGAWTSWGPYTECSASCQSNGNSFPTQSRQRFCVNSTLNGTCPFDITGDRIQTVQCSVGVICPVKGTWGAWSAWSSCSASCDAGVIQRSRVCSTPYPPGAGDNCIGNSTQSQPCKLFDCPLSCAIPKPCNCAQVKQWSTVPTFDQFQSRNLNLAAIDNVLGFLKSYGDDTVDKACEACNTMLLTTLRSNVANQLDQAKAARTNLELIKKDLRAVINCNGVILNNAGLWNLYDLTFERATMLDGVIIELNAIYLRFDAALTSCQSYGWIHHTFKTILRKCNL